jgi:hypothetical protein
VSFEILLTDLLIAVLRQIIITAYGKTIIRCCAAASCSITAMAQNPQGASPFLSLRETGVNRLHGM